MSYNKLKSLVANVEAIKTALQIHIQGRQATPEEKETLSQYSGFGGIKEVLNIGTDKPVSGDMEEPIRRLQELIDTYPYFTEAMKASVLTAFYTPKFLIDVVAKQIHATFKDNEPANALIPRTECRHWRFPPGSHVRHLRLCH